MKSFIHVAFALLVSSWSVESVNVHSHSQAHLGVGGGCPYMTQGGGFAKSGAAPGFKAQANYKGPYSQCDQYGTCDIVKRNQQNLEGNQGNTGPSAMMMSTEVCMDQQPPKSTGFKSCAAASAVVGGCDTVIGFCNLTCATCSPVFVSQYGKRSGTPYDISPDGQELALGAEFYFPKLERVKCKPYALADVVNTTREIFATTNTNKPASVRMGFHDAGDYNKWAGTGGADGRFAVMPEAWYGQSRTTNQGVVCVDQLMGTYKKTSLSLGDAVQICAIVAVEASGGPKFEEFNFSPGRAQIQPSVTSDGMLPNPNGIVPTLRDYYYRMGLNDTDIVTLMGAHTLGGGAGAAGSGYTGTFTPNQTMWNDEYFKQLVTYMEPPNASCQYWTMAPADRGANGGCHVGPMMNLQLPTDRALISDPFMFELVKSYANDFSLFNQEYVKSYKKLSELGKDISVQWCDYNA